MSARDGYNVHMLRRGKRRGVVANVWAAVPPTSRETVTERPVATPGKRRGLLKRTPPPMRPQSPWAS